MIWLYMNKEGGANERFKSPNYQRMANKSLVYLGRAYIDESMAIRRYSTTGKFARFRDLASGRWILLHGSLYLEKAY
jgi:hypothetical protein